MRSHWSGRLAFILAATGSAVGLGNIWKFPYIAGENGGGAFVLAYLVTIAVVGFPVLVAELYIGKKSQANAVSSFEVLHKPTSKFKVVGYFGVASAFMILSFYSVVGGWILSYLWNALSGSFSSMSSEQIDSSLGDLLKDPTSLVFWHSAFMIPTVAIVAGGIAKGIEKWAKILMPAFFLLLLVLLIVALQLDGFSQAVEFLFAPNFSKLTSAGLLEAVGHSFFTLSLGMGAMITYGSYLEENQNNLLSTSFTICLLDTFIALIAGLVMFSITFEFGQSPNSGPGLMFATMPTLFSQMSGGIWLLIAFFALVGFAALTSAIALLEVVVSFVDEKWNMKRRNSTILFGAIIWASGVLCALSFNVLEGKINLFDIFDKTTSSLLMPLGGLLTSLFFGWIIGEKPLIEMMGGKSSIYSKGLLWTLRVVAPIAIAVVMLHAVSDWLS